MHQITPTASYRAYLRPAGLHAEAGVLPFIQVKAANAEHAMRAAHAVTGHQVEAVERLCGLDVWWLESKATATPQRTVGMSLHEYLSSEGSLSPAQLCERAGIKNIDQLRQWRHGYANRQPGPAHCLAIERATNGQVTRAELRPDDYWLIWPDLSAPAKGAQA